MVLSPEPSLSRHTNFICQSCLGEAALKFNPLLHSNRKLRAGPRIVGIIGTKGWLERYGGRSQRIRIEIYILEVKQLVC